MNLTANDIAFVQSAMDTWAPLLLNGKGEWNELAAPIMGIKLCNPEHGEHIGDLILEDGWLGFQPVAK